MTASVLAGFWIYRLRPSWRLLDRVARRTGVEEAITVLADLGAGGPRLRAAYSLIGTRPDADLMLWLVGGDLESVRGPLLQLRGTGLGPHLEARDVYIGFGSPSRYAPDHRPAFLRGEQPGRYAAVYPFVKTPEWYLLPEEDRRRMMAEHGRLGRAFRVRANTLRAFGLGDHEHVVALEAESLEELVDCVEALRAASVRRYTQRDVPIYLGLRRDLEAAFRELMPVESVHGPG
ncbi:MAG TPA: chlorite dismutase family protein [Candidatus Dormibacteraeota bacterium]|nr:chlorite dismutase family protein [Candidatus Dormibacteraeota bacterium]